jgi:hypothetical protein
VTGQTSLKRWPWVQPESFHNDTLEDLRREFAIRVIWASTDESMLILTTGKRRNSVVLSWRILRSKS